MKDIEKTAILLTVKNLNDIFFFFHCRLLIEFANFIDVAITSVQARVIANLFDLNTMSPYLCCIFPSVQGAIQC